MQLADLQFLLTPEGQRWLRQTAETPVTSNNHLQVASRLRDQLEPALAQAVLETVLLRQHAAQKFSMANQMYFTHPALEQATSETVAIYRASRYAQAGFTRLADLGCGIGGDALALAAHASLIGVDLDPLRLAMARENVRAYGCADFFSPLQADLNSLPALDVQAVFFDPA
jgi:methylase of polypeptide subunit release factors